MNKRSIVVPHLISGCRILITLINILAIVHIASDILQKTEAIGIRRDRKVLSFLQ